MKLDVTQKIYGLNGKPMRVREGSEELATLRWACVEALMANHQDEQGLSGDDKLKRWRLAQTVQTSDSVDISIEDLGLVKKLVGKFFGPIVVGPVYEMLEGTTPPVPGNEGHAQPAVA